MQIHFIDIVAIGDVKFGAPCWLEVDHAMQWPWISEMPQLGETVSLQQGTPELARSYERAGIVRGQTPPEGLQAERYLSLAFSRNAPSPNSQLNTSGSQG